MGLKLHVLIEPLSKGELFPGGNGGSLGGKCMPAVCSPLIRRRSRRLSVDRAKEELMGFGELFVLRKSRNVDFL